MKLEFDFLKKKYLYHFAMGCHPEIAFDYLGNLYQICADFEKFYLDRVIVVKHEYYDGIEYERIAEASDFDELAAKEFHGHCLKELWNEFEFEEDIDWKYTYSDRDHVMITERQQYGVICNICADDKEVIYKVNTGKWLSERDEDIYYCREEELQYDMRESTVQEGRESYQWYLDRINGG